MDEYLSETVSISVNERNIARSAEPSMPEAIGSGVVKSVLGKGGAAVVYEIWNQKLEIMRAVKLWRPFLSEKVLKRFETEIKITAKLHHPNIVEIHNVGEWEGLPFIEMEKIDGFSLKELLKKRGVLPYEVALAVAICLCRALTYAHNHIYNLFGRRFRGVTHCDIKPANIMVGFSGTVKLMDFGIAHPASVPKVSGHNKITGSLQYMSPEQLGARKIDPRTDIYSLGVVFYEMVSGTKAFPAQSMEELIKKRNSNDFVALESFCKDVPQKIRSIISRCMEVDPDTRYRTSNELLQDLERAYRKITTIPPEQIISRFMSGKKLRKKQNLYSSVPVILLVVLGLLTLTVTAYVMKDTFHEWINPSEKTIFDQSQNSFYQTDDQVSDKNLPVDDHQAKTAPQKKPVSVSGSNTTRVVQRNRVRKKTQQSVVKKEKPAVVGVKPEKSTESYEDDLVQNQVEDKNEEAVTDEVILDQIQQFIDNKEFEPAKRLCKEFPIEDAEYFLIYAQLLAKQGQFMAAIEQAEKSLNYSSKRKSSEEIRGDMFYIKAQCLGAMFKQNGDEDIGQKAMEAWYDLKYMYRSNTSHLRYKHADKEIRNISSALQQM